MTLISVFRAATNHATSKGIIVKCTSPDGIAWAAEVTIYDDATYDTRDPSIVELADHSLLCNFFLYDHTSNDNIPQGLRVTKSVDNGGTWGAPVTPADSFTYGSACCGKIIQLAGGTLLLPYYGRDIGEARRSVRLMTSIDGGGTWGGEVTIADGQTDGIDYSEPNLFLLAGGDILCLIRTNIAIYASLSADNGATWSAAASVFAGTGAPHVIQLASGKLVCCYRSLTNARAALRTSTDNGVSWSDEMVFDTSSYVGMMYACPIERSGNVSIAHALETTGLAADVWFITLTAAELP